jgi:uncharacterized protein (TIGR00369 family)
MTDLTPEAWRAFFERTRETTVAGALDIRMVDIGPDHIVLRMPVTDASRQPMGLLHGGVSMVLVETAGSMHACWGLDLTTHHPVGIEISGSHLRSARDGHVLARGRVLRRARTLVVHEVQIEHEETGDLLCVGRVTNLIRAHHPPA